MFVFHLMGIRHTLKRLVLSPMFTVIAVVTLAIGIGANSAIFAVIDGVLLKPLPYPDANALVDVDHVAPGVSLENAGMSPFLYFTYREEGKTFSDIGIWWNSTATLTGVGEPEEIRSLEMTDGVLPILAVQPLLGRLFSRADDAPGSPETVILMYGYWRSKFGGDPSVVGRRVVLDGRAREVIGVLPETFRFLDLSPSMILPLQLNRGKTFLGNFSYQSVARLKDGVTLAQANADVARMIPIALKKFPPFPGYSVKMFEDARLGPDVKGLKQSVVGNLGSVLWVLMGTVGVVLLIACANVANLLLVRAEGRQHELAIRAALGAGWSDIARELLLESLTLGLLGGVAGVMLAYGALKLLTRFAPTNLPRIDQVSLDGRVLLFTLVISILAGALFALAPIAKYGVPLLGTALRSGGRSVSDSRERHRTRNTLVVVQVALALVLLISSGLMIRTFQALRRVEPGFSRPDELQTMRFSIPSSRVPDPATAVRIEQSIMERIAAVPGVSSVGLTSIVPMSNSGWHDPIFAEDHVYTESQIPPLREFKFVSPGLLKTMGNALVAGRDFTWTDAYEKRPVALITENMARELWHDPANAIGKRIRENNKSTWREVVGVVTNERDDGLDRPAPGIVMFPPLLADFSGEATFVGRSPAIVVRSIRTGSAGFVSEISQAVWSVDASLPLANVRTMREIVARSLARTSFALVMLAVAGAMALLLGIAGIYGVISYSVSQRTREIGIRKALGAQNAAVRRMFVVHGVRLAAVGIVCGIAAAIVLTRLMSSMLFDVSPLDPLTYGGVSLVLAAAAVIASFVPAWRATTLEAVEALRVE